MTQKEFIDSLLDYAFKQNYSDIHLATDEPIRVRNQVWMIVELTEMNGQSLQNIDLTVISGIIKEVIGEDWYSTFIDAKEYDSSYAPNENVRYRVNTYMDSMWYSMAFRLIPNTIPTLEQLGLGDVIKEISGKSKWLVLVTWPTGSWKSTNLAAMLEYINETYQKHIITIEDPIEFSFKSKKSLVNQRELGNHTLGFDVAIRSALREDPDVIMVWEMRDMETIRAAITLAETWHLVLSTLHTNDAVQTIDRIVDSFPPAQQAQIRMQLSQTLIAVLSQRLIPRADGKWRIATRELLVVDDAAKNLIITAKTHQLYSVLEVGASKWMILMDKYLLALYNSGKITKETLMSYVRDKDSISLMIKKW